MAPTFPASLGDADPRRGLAGITSYDISLDNQEVIVKTAIDFETIKAKIAKTGKEIRTAEVVA